MSIEIPSIFEEKGRAQKVNDPNDNPTLRAIWESMKNAARNGEAKRFELLQKLWEVFSREF